MIKNNNILCIKQVFYKHILLCGVSVSFACSAFSSGLEGVIVGEAISTVGSVINGIIQNADNNLPQEPQSTNLNNNSNLNTNTVGCTCCCNPTISINLSLPFRRIRDIFHSLRDSIFSRPPSDEIGISINKIEIDQEIRRVQLEELLGSY